MSCPVTFTQLQKAARKYERINDKHRGVLFGRVDDLDDAAHEVARLLVLYVKQVDTSWVNPPRHRQARKAAKRGT